MKNKLGQFYTTNHKQILNGMKIPDTINEKKIKNIIEPFVGKGHLLEFITNKEKYKIECYDIVNPKIQEHKINLNNSYVLPLKKYLNKSVVSFKKQDVLKHQLDYSDKFVITNPPYLARNKNKDKSLYDKYSTNDLYKCFIINLIKGKGTPPLGGIIIIPLNFWSSMRIKDKYLRKQFLDIFKIEKLNIFEKSVFDDTNYTICSFQFKLKSKNENNSCINIRIFNDEKEIQTINTKLNKNNYIIGGEIYKLEQNKNKKYNISRLTTKNKVLCGGNEFNPYITNILVKCIDDNSRNQIQMSYTKNKDRYIDETPKLSARSYATLVIKPSLNKKQQENLINKFNQFIKKKRQQYNSLFLTNYRENARKRISFKLVYKIINYLLNE